MVQFRYHALASLALLTAGHTVLAFQAPKPNTKPKASLDVSFVDRTLQQPESFFAPAETLFENPMAEKSVPVSPNTGGMACMTDLEKRLQSGVAFESTSTEPSIESSAMPQEPSNTLEQEQMVSSTFESKQPSIESVTISQEPSDTLEQEEMVSTSFPVDAEPSIESSAMPQVPPDTLVQEQKHSASKGLFFAQPSMESAAQELLDTMKQEEMVSSAFATDLAEVSDSDIDMKESSAVVVREESPAAVVQAESFASALASLDLSKISNVLSPPEAFEALVQKGEFNAASSTEKILFSAALGGCYVGMGAMVSLAVAGNSPDLAAADPGLQKLLFAALFPMNLLLAQQCGGSLYTGNTANMMAAVCEKRATFQDMGRVLGLSWIGNILGCGLFAVACKYAGVMEGGAGVLAAATLATKTSYELGPLLVKAIFCNWLVCLAVLLSTQSKDMGGKYISIWLPVSTFVSIGFEHSVANMFLLPAGLMSQHDITVSTALFHNLIPVTIGNAFSGALLVGATMSYLYGSLGKEVKN